MTQMVIATSRENLLQNKGASTGTTSEPRCEKTDVLHMPKQRYANMSVQYTANFNGCKKDNISAQMFRFLFFLLKTQIVGTR